MATDLVSIWNRALSVLGNAVEVQSDSENSPEANACRRFYEDARDELLQGFPWPFATTTATLALVETDPTTEWLYAYAYPTGCLKFGRILGDLRLEAANTRVPYVLRADRIIYTDRIDAVGEYVTQVTDTTEFSPAFAKALSLLLASYIAPRVTGGDPYKLQDRCEALQARALAFAQANCVNEEQPDQLPDAEWIRDR